MTTPTFTPPGHAVLGATHANDLKALKADVALFGAPHATGYRGDDNRVFEGAPKAFRKALAHDSDWIDHWDFDLDGTLHPTGTKLRVADLGDLTTAPGDGPGNRAMIEATARAILASGAIPMMIGGDDSVPIPFIAAFAKHGPITIVQVDAHIDWRQERRGEPLGLSSTMRRASEMKHVERIIQVGMRGIGSARASEVEAARAWGATLITAKRVHEEGLQLVLDLVPAKSRVIVTIDCDSMDAGIMPAVLAPTPGGLTYYQVKDLVAGVIAKAELAGFDIIEFVPGRDNSTGIAAYTAARILWHAVGRLASKTGKRTG